MNQIIYTVLISVSGIFVGLFPCNTLAQKQERISDADVAVFNERFEILKQTKVRLKGTLDDAEKSQRVKDEDLEHLRKDLNLSYLYALMDIERDLAILARPTDAITKDVDVPGLSSRDNDRISQIRLEIITAERTRIQKAIKDKKVNYGDEQFHLTLLEKEIRLLELYLRAVKKTDRKISKLEKAIAKEKKSWIQDEDGIKKLEADREKLLEEKKVISVSIFGYALGGGFDHQVTPSLKSAADLLLAVKKERENIIHFLRTGETNKGEGEKRGGSIGDTYVYSENLGIVLDISGSMTNFIEPLKDEIAETFESPHYREVRGCSLVAGHRYPSPGLYVNNHSYTMSRFGELLVVNQVDTLYWFCDLTDRQEAGALRHLLDMLIRSGAVFNVRSVSQDASKLLKPIITNFEKK